MKDVDELKEALLILLWRAADTATRGQVLADLCEQCAMARMTDDADAVAAEWLSELIRSGAPMPCNASGAENQKNYF